MYSDIQAHIHKEIKKSKIKKLSFLAHEGVNLRKKAFSARETGLSSVENSRYGP